MTGRGSSTHTRCEYGHGGKGHESKPELDPADVLAATRWLAVLVIAALAGLCFEVDRVGLVLAVVGRVHVEDARALAFGDDDHAALAGPPGS